MIYIDVIVIVIITITVGIIASGVARRHGCGKWKMILISSIFAIVGLCMTARAVYNFFASNFASDALALMIVVLYSATVPAIIQVGAELLSGDGSI